MKFTHNKDQLINILEKLYEDLIKEQEDYKKEVEIINKRVEIEWEAKCVEIKKSYNNLPENWWEQFLQKETSIEKGFILNKEHTEYKLNISSARKFLKKIDNNLDVQITSIEYYRPCMERCYVVDRFVAGSICKPHINAAWGEYSPEYKVVLSSDPHYRIRPFKKDYRGIELEEMIGKLKSIPTFVTEVTLEESDIEIIKKLK